MWQALLASLGIGAMGRAGLGATRMMAGDDTFEPSPTSQVVSMARPGDEEEKYAGLREKAADSVNRPTGLETSGPVGTLSKLTKNLPWNMPLERRTHALPQSASDLAWGSQAQTPAGIPMFWPLMLAAGGGGLYGGYKLVDVLLDARRKAETQSKLDTAEDRYTDLLKQSVDTQLEAELDELAELATQPAMEKEAASFWDPAGSAGGGMMAYALLSALVSGKLSYDYFKNRNQQSVAQEAMRRRSKERTGGVAPIELVPEPSIA